MDESSSLEEDFEDETDNFTWKIEDTEVTYRTKEPKIVRQYLLGCVLGKGSYGKVRECLDSETLERCAIKIVKKKLLRKLPGTSEASVQQEIQIMKELQSPYVVALIESFCNEEKGKLYIVLEYIGGGNMQELIDRAPNSQIPLSQAHRYISDLMHGLQYIHAQGVVHRDIKPGNLMLTLDGRLKISDFGVAEFLSSLEDPNYAPKAQGTPAFQPPEIARAGDKISGTEGDIWAAGITLYYSITGVFPFEGNTVYTVIENIAKAEILIPDWIVDDHPALHDLLNGMLNPSKNKRYDIHTILKHQWITGMEFEESEELELCPSKTNFSEDYINELYKQREADKHSSSNCCSVS